ncbi:hypothetical protein QQZ08_001782 [Neonectria magnoliae]|uniref:Protein kinase domain-containing protein n=1 Tax=Neonectria magnoliae TaxID=2732573 RepID=A0ABR1IE61_9HYPO
MDIYTTTATAVTQLLQITIFIKTVIANIKGFEDLPRDVALKLSLQLTTLEFFNRRFLDKQNGLMLPGNFPEWVAETIKDLLLKMHHVLSRKYDFLDEKTAVNKPSEEATGKQSFIDRTAAKSKALKGKGYDLQDVTQHFSQEAVYGLSSVSLQGTGLELVARRQKLAQSDAPPDFEGIKDEIIEDGLPVDGFQLGRSSSGDASVPIVIECYNYEYVDAWQVSQNLQRCTSEERHMETFWRLVRNLAWLLRNSGFSREIDDVAVGESPMIYSLQCLGYQDQVARRRVVFIYKLPPPPALPRQDFDTESPEKLLKPPLADRFSIAHSLALTVLALHASQWVHKNIWSRGILLFEKHEAGIRLLEVHSDTEDQKAQLLAFLCGWDYARKTYGRSGFSTNYDTEANLYRHPDRQGAPKKFSTRRHDIYALGVVMLEIGL